MPRSRARRFRRFFFIVQASTFAAHGVFGLGVSAALGVPLALAAAVGAWLCTASRLRSLVGEGRRSGWVTTWVDLPIFTHWGACLIGSAFFLLAGPVGAAAGWPEPPGGLATGAQVAYAAGFAISAWAVWIRRRWVRIVRIDVPVAKLDSAFSGYRIAHLTDLHIGNFDRKERGFAWAALANSLEADLVAVTGDLVTNGVEFYGDVAEVLSTLEARDGVVVSLGNHDQWDAALLARMIEAKGGRVLRNAAMTVARGDAQMVIAGIDDRYAGRDDLDVTLRRRVASAPTVLLSHYPDFFEAAAERGIDLVLSGHTHGGQMGVPFVNGWNLARFTGQRSRGLYSRGGSRLYVGAGLGTTGPPMRLGVAPEIALLVLRPA